MPENESLPILQNTSRLWNRTLMPTWLGCCSSCNFPRKAYDHRLEFSSTFLLVGWSPSLRNIPISRDQYHLEAWDEWFPPAWFDAWTLRTMIRWLKSEQYEVKQSVFCIDNIYEKSFWAKQMTNYLLHCLHEKKMLFNLNWRRHLSKKLTSFANWVI